MPSTMRLISKQTLGSDTGTVTFSNIPQTYTDLYLVVSGRSTRTTGSNSGVYLAFNGSSSNFSYRYINGSGSAASSGSGSTNFAGVIGQDTDTANTFSQYVLYLPNYTGSTNKSMSIEAVQETNAATAWLSAWAVLWSNTAAVTSVSLNIEAGAFSWKSGSTFYLYGVTSAAGSVPGVFGIDATGGNVSVTGGYKYHAFTASGTFNVAQPGWVDYLIVAGGGGGGGGVFNGGSGGGGAGGVLNASVFLPAGTYSVVVGGGGSGGTPNVQGSIGSDTRLGGLLGVTGGGGAGVGANTSAQAGLNGGSGGGAGSPSTSGTGTTVGLAVSGQGNNGGTGLHQSGTGAYGGGGGGKGAVGGNGSASSGGAGGAGVTVFGYAVGGGGGGGGGGTATPGGSGGSGGGGNGSGASNVDTDTAGGVNTGGGGGGGSASTGTGGSAGGSGLVVIRYAVT